MKLLLVNKFFYIHGGVDTYYFNLLDLLEAHGHQVVHFAMQDPRNRFSPHASDFVSGVDLQQSAGPWQSLRAAARILYSFEARRKIAALVDRERPQLAHLHHIYHQLSPSILPALKARGLPVLLTLHDYKLICPNYSLLTQGQVCERCAGHAFHHAVTHRCVQDSMLKSVLCAVEMTLHRWSGIYVDNVDLFLAPSRFLRGKMVEHGLPSAQIAYLPNFVPTERYRPSFDHRGYYVYIGRLERIKGVETLLRAAAAAGPVGGLALQIVGTGREQSHLQELARQLGADHVRFLGFQSGPALTDLLSGTAFVVVPSEWYENAPLAVLEAFACGKPVIASRLGGLPELVVDGETGLLFRPGDVDELRASIERLADDPQQVVALGRQARHRAETEFGSQAHYAALMTLYRQAMAGKT